MPRRSRLSVLLLLGALAQGGCSTPSGNEVDCGELCGLMVFGVLAIPCGVAAGVGCISGGATRCGEGAPPSDPPPTTNPTAESTPATSAAAPMEY